jgi:hypothetical protein
LLVNQGAGHFADGVVQLLGKAVDATQRKDKFARLFNAKLEKEIDRSIDPAGGRGFANGGVVGYSLVVLTM